MIKDKNFIFTSLQRWDSDIGSNAIDISKEISKNNRVLFVNTPVNLRSYLKYRKKYRKIFKNRLTEINPNLWILNCPFFPIPLGKIGISRLFDIINWCNNKLISICVKQATRRLKMDHFILFCDNDVYRSFYLKEMLAPDISIYYRRDNLISKYWKKQAARLEPKLCAKSDLVLANSEELASAVAIFNKYTFNVGQGVDLKNYDINKKYDVPDDLKNIKDPLVGYIGLITSLRLDADLIYAIARERPQYSFVMVGKEDDYFKRHKIHSLVNIHFLGNKPPEQVPNYIAGFDTCINPQKINEITMGNYPRKIDEYLSLGKPTVATRTGTMKIFENCVDLCLTVDDYLEAIDRAVNDHETKKIRLRVDMAHTHSWEKNVEKIYQQIENVSRRDENNR